MMDTSYTSATENISCFEKIKTLKHENHINPSCDYLSINTKANKLSKIYLLITHHPLQTNTVKKKQFTL